MKMSSPSGTTSPDDASASEDAVVAAQSDAASSMIDDVAIDTQTNATDWAGDSARLERKLGFVAEDPPPPMPPPPGAPGTAATAVAAEAAETDEGGVALETADSLEDDDYDPDTATGASPGMASACHDLGLFSLDAVTKKLNIKPPGQA